MVYGQIPQPIRPHFNFEGYLQGVPGQNGTNHQFHINWWISVCIYWTTDYGHPERAFFENPKLLGLGRQIGPKILGVFGVFSSKLQHPSWHCESLFHGFEHLVVFSTKFSGLNHIHIPKLGNSHHTSVVVWKMHPKFGKENGNQNWLIFWVMSGRLWIGGKL